MEALEVKTDPKYPYGILLTGQCFEEDAPFESYTGYIRNKDGSVKINGEDVLPGDISTCVEHIKTIGDFVPGEIAIVRKKNGASNSLRIYGGDTESIETSNGRLFYSNLISIEKRTDQTSYMTVGYIFELEDGSIKWATYVRVRSNVVTLHQANYLKQVSIPADKIKIIGYNSSVPPSFFVKFKVGDEIYIRDRNLKLNDLTGVDCPYKTFTVTKLSRKSNLENTIVDIEGNDFYIRHNMLEYFEHKSHSTNEWEKKKQEDVKISEIQKKLKDPNFVKQVTEEQSDILRSILLLVHEEEHIDVVSSKPGNEILLKARVWYPEIEITNSKNHTHTIRDLYISFNFRYDIRADTLRMDGVYGLRRSFSKDEILSLYAHSHLSNSTHLWQAFCLGETDTADMVGALCSKFDPMQFQALLYIMNSYVRWESLEGGPYYKMAGLRKTNQNTIDPNNYRDVPKNDLMFLIDNLQVPPPLDFNNGEFKVRFTPELENEIVRIFSIIDNSLLAKKVPDKEVYYVYEGNTTSESRDYRDRKDRVLRNQEKFQFKGQPIEVKIIEETDENEQNKLIVCIDPRIKNHLLNYLSLSINEFILTE